MHARRVHSLRIPSSSWPDLQSLACCRPRHHRVAAVESAFVLSTGVAATIKGRHFLPDPSDPKPGPGPQHYLPQLAYDSSHVRSPTMLFTMASRVKNQRLYISPSFNVDLLGKDSPGPGTYRWGHSFHFSAAPVLHVMEVTGHTPACDINTPLIAVLCTLCLTLCLAVAQSTSRMSAEC
jgi:hypothetical protein